MFKYVLPTETTYKLSIFIVCPGHCGVVQKPRIIKKVNGEFESYMGWRLALSSNTLVVKI